MRSFAIDESGSSVRALYATLAGIRSRGKCCSAIIERKMDKIKSGNDDLDESYEKQDQRFLLKKKLMIAETRPVRVGKEDKGKG